MKSGVTESKQVDGLESKPEGNGEEEHAHERFLSNITVLRSSTDLLPMLQGTLAGLKNRPQKVMFEYVKGPGLTNDDIVELEQNLFQIVEAYMEDWWELSTEKKCVCVKSIVQLSVNLSWVWIYTRWWYFVVFFIDYFFVKKPFLNTIQTQLSLIRSCMMVTYKFFYIVPFRFVG